MSKHDNFIIWKSWGLYIRRRLTQVDQAGYSKSTRWSHTSRWKTHRPNHTPDWPKSTHHAEETKIYNRFINKKIPFQFSVWNKIVNDKLLELSHVGKKAFFLFFSWGCLPRPRLLTINFKPLGRQTKWFHEKRNCSVLYLTIKTDWQNKN